MIARNALIIMAAAALSAAMAPIAFGAMVPSGPTGIPAVVFGGIDANPVRAKTFMARIGEGPKGTDHCRILEQHKPRSFNVSPFGPPPSGRLRMFLIDVRKPKLTVLRWRSDPNATAAKPEPLAVGKLAAQRFEGKATSWSAVISLPAEEPSYVVVRAAWSDPDDCAAGPDKLAAAAAFLP